MNSEELKIGDKVKIISDLNQLNRFMYQYAGKECQVISIERGNSGGQIVKLDIDNGYWFWSYKDKLSQIEKISEFTINSLINIGEEIRKSFLEIQEIKKNKIYPLEKRIFDFLNLFYLEKLKDLGLKIGQEISVKEIPGEFAVRVVNLEEYEKFDHSYVLSYLESMNSDSFIIVEGIRSKNVFLTRLEFIEY